MSEDLYQYCHVKYIFKITLQIFEVKPKSKEIVHFYLTCMQFSLHF